MSIRIFSSIMALTTLITLLPSFVHSEVLYVNHHYPSIIMMPPKKDYGEIIGRGLGTAISNGLNAGLQEWTNRIRERANQKNQYDNNVRVLKAYDIPNAEQLAYSDQETLQFLIREKIQESSKKGYEQAIGNMAGATTTTSTKRSTAARRNGC